MPSFSLVTHKERTNEKGAVTDTDRRRQLQTKDAILNETLERHYVSRQDAWANKVASMQNFRNNNQYEQDAIDDLNRKGQAAIPINVIHPAIEQAVAMMTTNKPQWRATAREDSDVKTAKVYSAMFEWIWDNSMGNSRAKNMIDDYKVGGRGVFMAYVDPNADYGRGEILITDVDPLDVYPDPNSKDRYWLDAAHIIVSRVFSREQIESMWPEAETMGIMKVASQSNPGSAIIGSEASSPGAPIGSINAQDAYSEKFKVIERYSRIKSNVYHIHDNTNEQESAKNEIEYEEYIKQPTAHVSDGEKEQFFTKGDGLELAMQMYNMGQQQGGQIDEQTVVFENPEDGTQVTITLLTIKDLIDDQLITVRKVQVNRIKLVITIGGSEYYNKILPISNYPIVPANNRWSRNPYPMSDVEFVKPKQQALNDIHRKIILNLASTTSQKIILPRGSFDRKDVEMQLARAGTSVIEYDAEMGEMKILGAGVMPNGLFTHFQLLKNEIQEDLGIFPMMSGSPVAAPDSNQGTLTLDEFAQRRIRSSLDDIEGTYNCLARVIVEMIPLVYTEQKVIRITNPNHTVNEQIANELQYDDLTEGIKKIQDLSQGYYDIKVVAGSTMPSDRWGERAYMKELLQMGAIDQVEFLKKNDVVDAEGVLMRMSYIKQLEAQLEEMQEENQKLESNLEAAKTNELTAKKQAELSKFKGQLRGVQEKTNAAGIIATSRINDQVKLQAAEAKAHAHE